MKRAASKGKSFEAGIPPAEISRATTRALRVMEKQGYLGSLIGDLTDLVIGRRVMERSRAIAVWYLFFRNPGWNPQPNLSPRKTSKRQVDYRMTRTTRDISA